MSRVLGGRTLGVRELFQALSYLQYPAMLIALYYAVKPYFNGFQLSIDDINYALLYMGVGVGLSSLQDPTRTQNEMSRKVWENPKKGKFVLWIFAFMSLGLVALGVIGVYLASTVVLNQLSLGLVALGLGMIGLLKTAIDMFEHHRLDRRVQP